MTISATTRQTLALSSPFPDLSETNDQLKQHFFKHLTGWTSVWSIAGVPRSITTSCGVTRCHCVTPPPLALGSARCQHDTGCANLKTSTWAVSRGHNSTHGQICQQCILFNWSPRTQHYSLMYSRKAYWGRRGSNNRLQTLHRVLEGEMGWKCSMHRTKQKCRRSVGRKTWEVNSKCSYTRCEVRTGSHLALMETVLHIKWQGSCLMKDLLHGVGERVR